MGGVTDGRVFNELSWSSICIGFLESGELLGTSPFSRDTEGVSYGLFLVELLFNFAVPGVLGTRPSNLEKMSARTPGGSTS
jgi:hypothetical protein